MNKEELKKEFVEPFKVWLKDNTDCKIEYYSYVYYLDEYIKSLKEFKKKYCKCCSFLIKH